MADNTKLRLPRDDSAYSDDVHDEIKDTLATLADIDQAYGRYRTMLERWSGPVANKDRLRAQLDALHRKDREPLVMRLADLHEHLAIASSLQTVH